MAIAGVGEVKVGRYMERPRVFVAVVLETNKEVRIAETTMEAAVRALL